MNDDKTNNRVDNLYWTDSKENNYHNGKMDRFQETHRKNIKKIALALSQKVIGTSRADGTEIVFQSMREAEEFGFQSEKISMCVNGLRKSHHNYTWRRAE